MAIDIDAASGYGTPSSGAQWAELLPRLASPRHRYNGSASGLSLVDALDAKNAAWAPIIGGMSPSTDPEFAKAVPSWTKTAFGYPTAATNVDGGDWINSVMAGPSMADNGAGTGSLLMFVLARQFVTSNPASARKMVGWGGSNVTLVVGSASDRRTRLLMGNTGSPTITLESAAENHNDGKVHPFLIQARETGANSAEISLDTDTDSLTGSLGAAANFANTEQIRIYTSEVLGSPSAASFDYLDIWIWRGVAALSASERVTLLEDLGWRTPPVIGVGKTFSFVPIGGIGLPMKGV